MYANRRRVGQIRALCTASLVCLGFVASGCAPSAETETLAPTGGGNTPPVGHSADTWPGGSLGGFESADGLETRETHGGGSDSATGGGDRAGDGAGFAAGPSGEGDSAAGSGEAAPSEPPPGGVGVPVDPDVPPAHGGLEGGEIDDNDDFEGFLNYLDDATAAWGADPMVHPVDVAERHVITVRDSAGETVADATVRLFVGETQITWGRTRADGRFAFFPGAYGAEADKYLVQVEQGAHRGAGSLQTGSETLEIALDADVAPGAPQLDVAFVIDCTGSMSEEIDRIKATITQIADRIAADETHPDLRFGLVAYRDHGDAFVTRTVNFTADVSAFQGAIDQLAADGGGDMPEALNEALHETMRALEWRSGEDGAAVRLTFVVADAPAHAYEQAPYTYDRAMLDAATMGVKVFPVASGGSDPIAELQFRQLAQFTLGHFVFITEGNGSVEGSGGSDYEVDPQQFRVEALDDLIVRLVSEELAAFDGR